MYGVLFSKLGPVVSYGLVYFRIRERKKRKLEGELADLEEKVPEARKTNKELGLVFDNVYAINTLVYVITVHNFKGPPPLGRIPKA